MTAKLIKPNFTGGEISPTLYSRVDLQKWHSGVATMRNFFVNYRGGASSRAGTRYVGTSIQEDDYAPRLIPFVFSVDQSYVLEFGHQYIRFILDGGYVTEDAQTIVDVTTASSATLTTSGAHDYSVGDFIFLSGIVGISSLNSRFFEVNSVSPTTFTLKDLFGNYVGTVGETYVSGGEVARLYQIDSPYNEEDLDYLKYAQSADVMTITHKSYPIYELSRNDATDWSIETVDFASSIDPPTTLTVTRTDSGTTRYSYKVTAVDYATGDESQPSPEGSVTNSTTISVSIGAIEITWDAVANAKYYNVYKGPEGIHGADIPIGSIYGFAGFCYGTAFVDSNIVEDASKTPPKHDNPFAPGRILSITMTATGSGYTQSATSATITSSTGSGVLLTPVVQSGEVVAVIVESEGEDYVETDTVSISGDGSGATATLVLGPVSGTYPGVVTYFQQRRMFASTTQEPDTYFMSQPGAFSNFDASLPTVDSDAIIGTPWSTQVNGIAAMVSMPGGVVILTGGGAWQLSGGQQSISVTPSRQQATPQAYNGCSPVVMPIVINYDILYVQQKGSAVYDLSYNFFVNIYTGEDLTVMSSHLFKDRTISEWCWSQEPYKIVWVVQSDGTLLSLTFLKEQEIRGWARHDTQGQFVSVCSISESPDDAVYFVVKRYIQGAYRYYIERMDARRWDTVEDSWCVDAGLSTTLEYPDATLTISEKTGDDVDFYSSTSVFSSGDVGKVIRAGGGKATITSYSSNTHVVADIDEDIKKVVPSRTNDSPLPVKSGDWSMSSESTTLSGLHHLEGESVAILADGSVVEDQVVTDGQITLQTAASYVVAGLPFQAQLQTLELDVQGQATTVQGARKSIPSVTLRLEASRGAKVGTNQMDSAAQGSGSIETWSRLREIRDRLHSADAGTAVPLFTGDIEIGVDGQWDVRGKVAIQQDYPLPLTVTGIMPNFNVGDENG